MPSVPSTADAVVVGGGTVGAWCAYFLRRQGVRRVALLERATLGRGASSRAAGIVRCQGGTAATVRLGMWSRDFYLAQRDELAIDSGFVAQGYFLPAFDDDQVAAAQTRVEMQRGCGLDVQWLDADAATGRFPVLARGSHRGGTFAPGDGYIDPSRNVMAYTVALSATGVELHEGVAFTGLTTSGVRVTAVETSEGPIATDAVVLTGGPGIAEVGRLAGLRLHAGGVRHQVAVTEAHGDFDPGRTPMVFDVPSGLYCRPHEGGLLFGMSNPDEEAGEARALDWPYLTAMRGRLEELVPAVKGLGIRTVWAATIDFTFDHLPLLGPALRDGDRIIGVTVASAAGHGMMWGPAVAQAAADIALSGTTDVVDAGPFGLDRFDPDGRSSLASDPIDLPFPERTPTL